MTTKRITDRETRQPRSSPSDIDVQLLNTVLIRIQGAPPSATCGYCTFVFTPELEVGMLPCGHAFHESCARVAILSFLVGSNHDHKNCACPCCEQPVFPEKRAARAQNPEVALSLAYSLWAGGRRAWLYYGEVWERWGKIEELATKHRVQRNEKWEVSNEILGAAFIEVDSLIWAHKPGERALIFDLREKVRVSVDALKPLEGTMLEKEVKVWLEVSEIVACLDDWTTVTREELKVELMESVGWLLTDLYMMRFNALSKRRCYEIVLGVVERWVVVAALLSGLKM